QNLSILRLFFSAIFCLSFGFFFFDCSDMAGATAFKPWLLKFLRKTYCFILTSISRTHSPYLFYSFADDFLESSGTGVHGGTDTDREHANSLTHTAGDVPLSHRRLTTFVATL
uniref:Uncharacterized protein n=1 Tax=Neogobius melanostomus TaxID=47308 RepID=A0A8C6THW0_9GOBI